MNQLTIYNKGLNIAHFDFDFSYLPFEHSYMPSLMAFLFKRSTVEEVLQIRIFLDYFNTIVDRNIDLALVCQERLAQSIVLHSPMENS